MVQRLDAQVLTMNESMPVVIDMIFSEPTYLLYFFVFLAVAVGWWFLGRLIYRRVLKANLDSEMPYKWAIPMAAVLLLGWFTGMRGHLTDKPPLRAENAVFCSNSYLNQIGLNPVFTFLKAQAPTEEYKGLKAKATHAMLKKISKSVEKESDILWNFTKFLVAKDGTTVVRFAPTTEPKDMEKAIEEML